MLAQKEVDHLNWFNKVNELWTNQKIAQIDAQTDDHECDFGKWYDSPETHNLKNIKVFTEVGRYHVKVHTYAHQIVEMMHNGEKEKASRLMEAFEKEREKLFEALNELYLL